MVLTSTGSDTGRTPSAGRAMTTVNDVVIPDGLAAAPLGTLPDPTRS
jgi:hypothetical protein